MTQQTEIRTLKGGSIDYAHYIARGHEIRSNDAHRAVATMAKMLRTGCMKLLSLTVQMHQNARKSRRPVPQNDTEMNMETVQTHAVRPVVRSRTWVHAVHRAIPAR